MSDSKIIFYNAVVCPYAQRAAIALRESGALYETIDIDLVNKPEWYKDVNPDTKVPALGVEGQNIAESLVIIEYINDRFPKANLLPKEAIRRANVRFVIEFFTTKINGVFFKYLFGSQDESSFEEFDKEINASLVRLDKLLTQQSATGPYFLGNEFSLADIAIAPFFLRILGFSKIYLKGYQFEALKTHPRLEEFIKGITTRPSVTETYVGDEEYIKRFSERYNLTKK
ncbi:glutathione S-transferase [Thamnidium elegans]|nr:glutathione S-transferase [Thamnidium elegans]